MTESDGASLLACKIMPESRELMDHRLSFFSEAKDLDLSPLQVAVLEDPIRS